MGNWQKHNTKAEKETRRAKYRILGIMGYCAEAAHRARDFSWNKVHYLCANFSDSLNTIHRNHS